MSTIQSTSALKIARLDLTTTTRTVLYTTPSNRSAIVESIIISDDSGLGSKITLTITDSSSNIFNLFNLKSISANGTVELLSRDLLLTGGDVLKAKAVDSNRLHIVSSITEIPS
tara:strand:- start:39 stop:380 length:342 start_codon:yes stop_codon:yes gene_type:complete